MSLEKKAFDDRFQRASAIISHAGMGAITMALDHGKPLLVMPRQRRLHEVVNDHQAALAEKFAALGHLLLARDETQLRAKVEQLRSFVPRPRQAHPEVVARKIGALFGDPPRRRGRSSSAALSDPARKNVAGADGVPYSWHSPKQTVTLAD